MARLKGLDEMPDHTGLEIDWDAVLPGTYSGRSTLPGRRRKAVTSRVRLASIVLTALVVVGGGYVFSQGLIPTGAEIRGEMDRRISALSSSRERSDTLPPATRPGIDGVRQDGISTQNGRDGFYRERLGVQFPVGRIDQALPWDAGTPLSPVTLHDATGNGLFKVIRFRSLSGDQIMTTAHIAPGGEVQLQVAPGGYLITIAEGSAWHEDGRQFGDGGRYYAPQPLDVRNGQAIRIELPKAIGSDAQPLSSKEEF